MKKDQGHRDSEHLRRKLLLYRIRFVSTDLSYPGEKEKRLNYSKQGSKYFRIYEPCCFCHRSSAPPLEHRSSHWRPVNESLGLCSTETLFMGTEIWISCNFHVSQNIILIFPSCLKNVKTILSSQVVQKEEAAWVCPPGHCTSLRHRPVMVCWLSGYVISHLWTSVSSSENKRLILKEPWYSFLH